jgi:hypothetical protein
MKANGPMKRQRLNRLSPAEHVELNRQFKDAMEAGLITLIRPSHSEFGSPILMCVKLVARCAYALTIMVLTRLRLRMPTHFRVWMTLLMT